MSHAYGAIHEASAAALSSPAISSPTLYIGGAVVLTSLLLNVKKITPHWHHTINEGEVGVWLSRGRPIPLKGVIREDIKAAEEADPFSAEAHYRIEEEGWYMIPPFRTLQTVDVADQPLPVRFPLETKADEGKPQQKMNIHATLTWHVSPEGDNPVRAITRVKHLKTDKKDAEAKDPERHENPLVHPLQGQVEQICTKGLGRILSGRNAEYLDRLTYLGETEEQERRFQDIRNRIQEKTIRICSPELIYYGVKLKGVDFVPVVRTPEQVQADALLSLSPRSAAVAAVTNEHVGLNGTGIPDEFRRNNVVPLDKHQSPNGVHPSY